MDSTIHVSIVEDNKRFREGLELILNETPGYTCIGSFGDCESAIKEIGDVKPDILLMDVELPGMSGIDGVEKIRKKFPDLDMVMLTDHGKEEYVFEALRAGANGYLIKTTQPARLLEDIRIVYEGGSVMSPKIARMVAGFFQINVDSPSPLTKRETEILQLAGEHNNNREIAESLFISSDTVRTHFKNIYGKLGVHSKVEAYSKASKKDWI
ncbi:MAG: response regulator transcription factor [Candidatus Marinimicrobia bacterium]|nr:response regulator transcription factor [Candidatus Neomarinimicrobiota bacterium]